MNFGKAIRIARSIADLSQEELARRSSLDRSYLSLIESGSRKPTVQKLQAVSNGLRIPFHLLTLLATEPEDANHLDDEHVTGLAKELTRLLLERPADESRISRQTASGKPQRSRIPARNKKKRAA